MAKEKQPKIPMDQMTADQRYDEALRYIAMADHIVHNRWAEKYYNKALKFLKPIRAEKPEAKTLYKKTQKSLYTVRAEAQCRKYERVAAMRDVAATEKEMTQVVRNFREIGAYGDKYLILDEFLDEDLRERVSHCRDANDQAKICEERLHKMQNRRIARNIGILGVLILLIIGGFFFSKTIAFDRVVGQLEEMVGQDTRAWARYKQAWLRSGDEADHQRYLELRYEDGLNSYNAGDLDAAYSTLKVLAVEENYLDSTEYFTICEKERLADAEIGSTLAYGDCDWILLAREGDQVLLLKNIACDARVFDDSKENVTWADSQARAWINSDFLTAHLSDAEIAAIVETEVSTNPNARYGTQGGEDTLDQAFLLSAEEVETYKDQLKTTTKSWWLRTTGANDGSMAYVNNEIEIMWYGCDVAEGYESIRMKPAVWVSTQ